MNCDTKEFVQVLQKLEELSIKGNNLASELLKYSNTSLYSKIQLDCELERYKTECRERIQGLNAT